MCMAKIKICGITRKEDIQSVNKYIPEYIGFVFAQGRRRVSPGQAAMLIKVLDHRIKKVGVFVNESIEDISNIARTCSLDAVQIHGDESPDYLNRLREKLDGECWTDVTDKVEIWKGVRVKGADSLKDLKSYNADAYLLDAYVEGSYGGAGRTFNWELAVKAGEQGKIILAGGLDKHNVLKARNLVHPYAVDVSSGVETDGFKDETKIKDFICISRSY